MASVPEASLNKILYVEDDPDIRAIAELALQDVGGFNAALCSSGQQALEVAPPWLNPDMCNNALPAAELAKRDLLNLHPRHVRVHLAVHLLQRVQKGAVW